MFMRMRFVWANAILLANTAIVATAFAQKERVPQTVDTHALAEEEVKQLLLMDTNRNGKISRQEWTKFIGKRVHSIQK